MEGFDIGFSFGNLIFCCIIPAHVLNHPATHSQQRYRWLDLFARGARVQFDFRSDQVFQFGARSDCDDWWIRRVFLVEADGTRRVFIDRDRSAICWSRWLSLGKIDFPKDA